ncbi:GAP family protein [Cyanobium sp. Morenito 9A2]|uniref:GAP family protein n=1 Tax=Cyanobium sp. Morenito 9A2 TaxID=2823718 RepID=UPI0020CC29E5|nr:GAP family protein [Cyanobium sp. Morenito 9A2]MCP9850878.1 GAP family protein [Cyanobium sp. Morenito 9A2]
MATPSSFPAVALEVLPLALGAAVSPLVLLGQLFNLSQPGAGLRRGWSFAAGSAVVVTIWLGLGLLVAGVLPPRHAGPDPVSAAVRLMLALVLVALGVWILNRSASPGGPSTGPVVPPTAKTPSTSGHPPGRAFLLGLGTMAANLTSLVLVLPASEDLARSGLPRGLQAPLVLAVGLITLLPALAPPMAVTLAGAPGRLALKQLGDWTKAHQRSINATLCFLFALVLGWSGLGRL